MLKYFAPSLLLICFLIPSSVGAASVAVKFVILKPTDGTVGTPVTVTIEAQKSNNQVDTAYQNDVTLVTSGSATGGGLVDIVNGVGTRGINDSVAETVILSLSDTEATGLDVSSTREVVFAPLGGGAVWNQSNFWFRDDDGSESSATSLGNPGAEVGTDDAVSIKDQTEFNRGKIFRLRIAFRAQQDLGTIKPRLEFREEKSNNWQVVGTEGVFVLRDSPNVANGVPTTQQVAAGSGFVPGLFLDTQNLAPEFLVLSKNEKTDYEWSLELTYEEFHQATGKTYYFRVTNDGVPLDLYNYARMIFGPVTSGQPTEIKFSGRAYPESKITIFAKKFDEEFPIKRQDIVSLTGEFDVSYIGILQSNYNYSLVIEDREGRVSQVKSYNLGVYANTLNAKDILAPPTLGFLRSVLSKGDFVSVRGYASPGNSVELEIDNRIITGKVTAGGDGRYEWLVNTAGLDFGNHKVRARQSGGFQKISEWSPTAVFVISKLISPKTDFNNDGIISINDWSVFLSRWGSKDEALKKQIDLNGDDKVNISDFSIFIRTVKL